MSNPKEQLQTIDPAALAQVSGGAVTATTSNDQIMTALTGILDSIQQLTSQNNGSGGMNQQEMMMLMMIMAQRNQQGSAATAAASGGWPWSQQPIIYY